jgi:peptide/nickel transport system substrate-binding protein
MRSLHIRSLLAVIAGGALIAGCGTSAGNSGSTSNTSSAGTPVYGGTLDVARSADMTNWDPTQFNDNPSIWGSEMVEANLVRTSPDGKTVEPYIASSWTISDAGKVYTFHLNPLAKFCDGSQVTSADVLYSLNRAEYGKTSQVNWMFPEGIAITAPNAETVVLTLKAPEAPLLDFLSIWGTAIVSKAYVEKVGESGEADKPMGAGPFCVTNWTRGVSATLVKNKYFWIKDSKGRRLPYLNGINMSVIASDTSRVVALESHQVQVSTTVPATEYSELSSYSGVTTGRSSLLGTAVLTMNVRKGCLASVDVRQALDYDINRDALVKAVLFGYGTPSENPLNNAGYSTNAYGYSYNPTKAAALMKASPCPNGFTTSAYYDAGDTEGQKTLTILKAEWATLKVNLQIQAVETATLNTEEAAGQFNMWYGLGTNDIYDPAEDLPFEMLPISEGGEASGYSGWNNATLDKLVPEAEAEMDPTVRAQQYNTIQKIFMADGPSLFLFTPQNLWAESSNVHGFIEYFTGAQSWAYVWMSPS